MSDLVLIAASGFVDALVSVESDMLAFRLSSACADVDFGFFPDLDVCSGGRVAFQPCVSVVFVS